MVRVRGGVGGLSDSNDRDGRVFLVEGRGWSWSLGLDFVFVSYFFRIEFFFFGGMIVLFI